MTFRPYFETALRLFVNILSCCRTIVKMLPLTVPAIKSKSHNFFSYLSDCSLKHNYNDVPLVQDPQVYETLKDAGIKELTAKHVSHLFIRFVCPDGTTIQSRNDQPSSCTVSVSYKAFVKIWFHQFILICSKCAAWISKLCCVGLEYRPQLFYSVGKLGEYLVTSWNTLA